MLLMNLAYLPHVLDVFYKRPQATASTGRASMDIDGGTATRVTAQYVALALAWGASFLFIKIGLQGLSPGQVVLGRLVAGAIALGLISLVRRSRLPRELVVWGHLAVVAILLCDVPFFLFAWAEQNMPSGLASIYNAATPLMATLWALLALPGERLTWGRMVGLIMGFGGVILVLAPWRSAGGGQMRAQLACLAATACYGAAFTYLRRYVSPRGITALSTATVQVTLGAGIAIVAAPWVATTQMHLSGSVIGSILVLGAVGTGIAYIWNTNIVAGWGAAIASTVTYLTPVVGVILGAFLLAEPVSWSEPVGALIVILGILAMQNRISPVGRHLQLLFRAGRKSEALCPEEGTPVPSQRAGGPINKS